VLLISYIVERIELQGSLLLLWKAILLLGNNCGQCISAYMFVKSL